MEWRRKRGGSGASRRLSVATTATARVARVRAVVGTGRAFAEGSRDATRDAGEGERARGCTGERGERGRQRESEGEGEGEGRFLPAARAAMQRAMAVAARTADCGGDLDLD